MWYNRTGDNKMNLFQRIIECEKEEVDSIIEEAIKEVDKNAEPIEKLGFANSFMCNNAFKGFIPLKTRIRYSNMSMEDYGMGTTDFIYEFAHFIKKYQITSKGALIYYLESFINNYFGYSGKMERETIFETNAWTSSKTDEEYFAALANNKIGDLKGKGAAECTERGALAQQILSIFGTETYYCMGCVDLGNRQEGHCFNIVKRKNDYALLDYSIPVTSYKDDGSVKAFYPFVGTLSNAEFLEFIDTGIIKSFDDYCLKGNQEEKIDRKRSYVVGKFEIKKEFENDIIK